MVASKTYSAVSFKTTEFQIIFLYLSSNYDKEEVFKLLNNWIHRDGPTATMSDINENIMNSSKMEAFMISKGFSQIVKKSTHIQGLLIDHIYINQPMKEKKRFEQKL